MLFKDVYKIYNNIIFNKNCKNNNRKKQINIDLHNLKNNSY